MKTLLLSITGALLVCTLVAGPSFARDAGSKARGEFGTGFSGSSHHQSYGNYSFGSNMGVMSSNYQSFSYQPQASQGVVVGQDQAKGDVNSQPVQSYRSYSYQPQPRAMNYAPAQTHRDPWSYPKTDRRRYQH